MVSKFTAEAVKDNLLMLIYRRNYMAVNPFWYFFQLLLFHNQNPGNRFYQHKNRQGDINFFFIIFQFIQGEIYGNVSIL